MKRVAVKLRPEADDAALAALETRHALVAIRRIPPLRISIYEAAETVVEALAREPLVEYVEEDHTMTVL